MANTSDPLMAGSPAPVTDAQTVLDIEPPPAINTSPSPPPQDLNNTTSSDAAALTHDDSTMATTTATESCKSDRDPFAACHQVLYTSELCADIIGNFEDWELSHVAHIGGPFLRLLQERREWRGKPFAFYQAPGLPFVLNQHLYWHTTFCGHPRHPPCNCDIHDSISDFKWYHGGYLPPFEIDMTDRNAPIVLRFNTPGAYEEVVTALKSGEFFLDQVFGSQPKDVKIVIHNVGGFYDDRAWMGPPGPIKWTTAELTINSRNLRMRGMFRVVKNLFECARAVDKKRAAGELDWNEETGTIANSNWQHFFDKKALKAMVSTEPKYTWYWKEGRANRIFGATFAEHFADRLARDGDFRFDEPREPRDVLREERDYFALHHISHDMGSAEYILWG